MHRKMVKTILRWVWKWSRFPAVMERRMAAQSVDALFRMRCQSQCAMVMTGW